MSTARSTRRVTVAPFWRVAHSFHAVDVWLGPLWPLCFGVRVLIRFLPQRDTADEKQARARRRRRRPARRLRAVAHRGPDPHLRPALRWREHAGERSLQGYDVVGGSD